MRAQHASARWQQDLTRQREVCEHTREGRDDVVTELLAEYPDDPTAFYEGTLRLEAPQTL